MHKIEWLENLQHKSTGFTSIRTGQKMACVSREGMDLKGNYQPDTGVEYIMRVEVGTLYRLPVDAKPNEQADIYKSARRQLSREIFKEVLDALYQIENCVHAGEAQEALDEIKNIRDQITL